MQVKSIIQFSLFVIVAPIIVCAQSTSLDLRRALEIAESGNLELRAARQQRAIAIAGIKTAGQYPNPNITVGATRDLPHESVAVDQQVELARQRAKRIAVAREEQRGSEIDITTLSRSIRHRTRTAFYTLMNTQAQTAQAKSARDLAAKLRDVAKQRFDAGDVAELDVLETDVELSRADAEYEAAQMEENSAQAELSVLLGKNLDEKLVLAGKLESLPQPASLAENNTKALEVSPAVQKAMQDVVTEEKRLILAKANRVPNIDLQINTALNSPPTYHAALGGQVSMSVPLWYRGQGEIAASTAQIELLKLTLQSQKLSATSEVAVAYYDYTAKAGLAARYTNSILPQTEKLSVMAEDSYKAGKSNLLTVIDAQRKLNDVRREYLSALFDVQNAFAALEEAVGAPLD